MNNKSIHTHMRHEMGDKKLFEQAKAYAFDYMDTIAARTVFPDGRAIANLARFDEPMPDNPHAGEDVLHLLHVYGSPGTVAQTGGRYFGFVNGNVIPTALATRWLSDTWDQNPALYVISPIVAKLEQICEQWLTDLFGLPFDSAAGFVSGTSIATMCGLAAARHTLLKRLDWDVNTKGLFGAPPFRVVVSRQAHGTVFKALALLGLGKDRVELVPADAQGRMKTDKLPTLDANTLLILQASCEKVISRRKHRILKQSWPTARTCLLTGVPVLPGPTVSGLSNPASAKKNYWWPRWITGTSGKSGKISIPPVIMPDPM